jgi:hypothetical protein
VWLTGCGVAHRVRLGSQGASWLTGCSAAQWLAHAPSVRQARACSIPALVSAGVNLLSRDMPHSGREDFIKRKQEMVIIRDMENISILTRGSMQDITVARLQSLRVHTCCSLLY